MVHTKSDGSKNRKKVRRLLWTAKRLKFNEVNENESYAIKIINEDCNKSLLFREGGLLSNDKLCLESSPISTRKMVGL